MPRCIEWFFLFVFLQQTVVGSHGCPQMPSIPARVVTKRSVIELQVCFVLHLRCTSSYIELLFKKNKKKQRWVTPKHATRGR